MNPHDSWLPGALTRAAASALAVSLVGTVLVAATATPTAAADESLLSTSGTTWRYLDDNTNPAGASADQRVWTTTAFDDNHGSLGVTRKLGYRENGTTTEVRDGSAVVSRRFRMDREDWDARPDWMRPDVTLHGVDAVRTLLDIA